MSPYTKLLKRYTSTDEFPVVYCFWHDHLNIKLAFKVGTHDGTSPCNKSQGLVASCELATSPYN